MTLDFILSAWPWILMGLTIALFFRFNFQNKKNQLNTDLEKREDEGPDNYGLLGMLIGMTIGNALSYSLFRNSSYGMSLGMLIGLTVGTRIKKKR